MGDGNDVPMLVIFKRANPDPNEENTVETDFLLRFLVEQLLLYS